MDTEKSGTMLTQVVNVSGMRFEMSENTWAEIKKTMPEASRATLGQTGSKVPQTGPQVTWQTGSEVFLARHAGVFQSILYHHQGGELHLPVDVCPSSFKAELAFYGVDEAALAKCCFTKYVNFFDDQDILKILEKDESEKLAERAKLVRMKSNGGWRGIQAHVWLVLNEPFSSKAAKVYFVASAIFIMVSLFALVAGTHPAFQRDLKVTEWREYFGDEWQRYKHQVLPEPAAEAEAEPETESEPETTSEPETMSEPETTSEPESANEEVALPENAFVRYAYLEYTEYICIVVFSLDLCTRVIFCPYRYSLLFSFLNWVDVFALSVMYIRYIVESLYPKEKYEASALDILHCLQIVRVFRLLRLVKNFSGFRVLMYAFKASAKEMLLMTMFLFIAMLLFATFAFFSGDDTFTSIPDAFWWAIVTMTTVGYGDMVPKRELSRLVGVVCAVTGVCLIAVIIPIFVNNFILFYSYSKVWGKKYESDQRHKSRTKITQVVSVEGLQAKDGKY